MTAVRAMTDAEDAAGDTGGGALRGRRRLQAEDALLAAPVLLWALFAWSRRWVTDDGLIAARTVRQILSGHGPVFNRGERVEANTSALWTWLTAGVSWVTRLDVYTVFLVLGMLLAPAGLLLAQLGTRRLLRSGSSPGAVGGPVSAGRSAARRPLVPLGALVVAALPPFWDFATSGLETSLVFGWLGLCWWLLSGWQHGRLAGRAVVLGLGWLVRPDMLLASLGFLAVLLALTWRGPRRAVGLLAAAAALPLAYEVFRMGYYGIIVPNTALTKEASASDLGQGMVYLGDYVQPYALWLPAAFLVVFVALIRPWRRMARAARLIWWSALVVGLVLGAYVVYIGGDFMHARMLLPATFTLLMPVMCVPLPEWDGLRAVAAASAMAGTVAWAVVCETHLRHTPPTFYIPANGIVDERSYWVLRTADPNPVDAAPYVHMMSGTTDPAAGLQRILDSTGQPDGAAADLYVIDGTGRLVGVPLTGPAPVALPGELLGTLGALVPLDGIAIDDHGLSYAVGSHLEMNGSRPGHRKTTAITWFLADYSAAQDGDVIGSGAVVTARQDLLCGPLAELQQATRAPLTFGRFWSNFFHAYSMSTFRVPNDPVEAAGKLCG